MYAETILLNEGMKTLVKKFGYVEAERFVALLLREPFDYTKQRGALLKDFDDMSIEEISALAMKEYENSK